MLGRSFILCMCFVAAAGLITRAARPEPAPARTSFDHFPMQLGEWRGVQQPPLEPNVLAILGVDDYVTRAYVTPDRSGVGLYIGYYGSQRQGDTMHSPLNCLPGSGWEPVSKTMLPVSVESRVAGAPDQTITINRYVIQKGLDKQLVLYWYQSHGRVVASEYWGKFYLIRDAVRMNRTDGALVRVIAPIIGEEGGAQAERTAIQFVKVLFPFLGDYLPV
jgi:EpsI family protein